MATRVIPFPVQCRCDEKQEREDTSTGSVEEIHTSIRNPTQYLLQEMRSA